MMSKQGRHTVGDYVTLQRGTTYKGSLVGQQGPALLGLGSIKPGGGFRTDDYKTYGGDCPPHLMLFPGDLYVALKGATKDGKMIGSVARIPPRVSSGRLTQDTVKLVFHNQDPDDARYIYWILRTPQYRAYCEARAMGSAVVALSRQDFLGYPVPPLSSTRQRLVDLCEALDDKIDLNRRMHATLEELARALFQSWFVDFDPVRARAAGRAPAGLDAATAALFPDAFEVVDGREVPRGWKLGDLSHLSLLNPETWSRATRPNDIRYIDLSSTKWGRIEEISVYKQQDPPTRAQRVLRIGDTIIGTVRPGNGSYALISEDGLTGSTGFAVLRPRKRELAEFIYLATTAPDHIEQLSVLADGGAYPAVRPEIVISKPTVIPSNPVLTRFSELTNPLLTRAAGNELQSRTLAALRDTLLPKLIAGELRVGDAERLVEDGQ